MDVRKLMEEAADESYNSDKFEIEPLNTSTGKLSSLRNVGGTNLNPLSSIRPSTPLGKIKPQSILDENPSDTLKVPPKTPPPPINDEDRDTAYQRKSAKYSVHAESKKDVTPSDDSENMDRVKSVAANKKKSGNVWDDISVSDDGSELESKLQNTNNTPEIIKAVYYGNLKDVFNFIKENKNAVLKKDRHGWNSVHWACSKGFDDILEVLLNHLRDIHGADVLKSVLECADSISGWCPLHVSIIINIVILYLSNNEIQRFMFFIYNDLVTYSDSGSWSSFKLR